MSIILYYNIKMLNLFCCTAIAKWKFFKINKPVGYSVHCKAVG